jgi:hypothetical protein
MLDKVGAPDWTTLKSFCKAFADGLTKGNLLPAQVQATARKAAHANGLKTPRAFNVASRQVGNLLVNAWQKAQAAGAKGTDAFEEGLAETLRDKAPTTAQEFDDALEFALGYAEGETGMRLARIVARYLQAASMDRDEYWQWLRSIKVGDTIMFHWTAGSGGHYKGKVRVVKVNPKSVVGELLEGVPTEWGEGYPVGHKLRLPTNPIDRRFSEMFNAPAPVGVDHITRPKR